MKQQPTVKAPAETFTGDAWFDVIAAATSWRCGRATRSTRRRASGTHQRGRKPVTAWTNDELTRVGDAEELEIASARPDGTLTRARTIWVVPHGGDLYVRSVNGPTAAWFRGTQARRVGHISAGGVEKDVAFTDADHSLDDQIDAAYRNKYHRYARSITDSITSPGARSTTIRLLPR
jgi:hypothetical protein